MPPPPSHLRGLIMQKEKELHDINEYRIHTLESLLAEKERDVNEGKQRLAKLKEDCTYNLRLLEERDRLEGCLVDARTPRDAALCRARAAEARIGRKRKAMRQLAAQSAAHVRTTASRLRKLASELSQSRME